LTLDVDPTWAAPGDVVTFTVTAHNPGLTPLAGLTLTDALPDGLGYVTGSAVGFTYSASQKQLTWQPAEVVAGAPITGSFQARVQGLALGDMVTNTVTASAAGVTGPISASAAVEVVSLRNNEAWATPEQGGLLRSTDDRVLLRVPAGAVRGRTRFTYAPVTDAPNPPPGLRFAFRLEAQDEQGQAVREFPAALVLTVAYRLPPDTPWPGLFYYNATTGAWPAVANHYERQRGQLAAHLDHFTLFAIASNLVDFEFDPGPRVRGAQPQLFSGSIGYTYPFALPPGRGGLTPQLGLTYSSSRHEREMGHYSMVGHGWDILGASYVSRNPSNPGGQPITLVLNGATYTIDTTTWVVKEDPFLRVSAYYENSDYVGLQVKTRDGTLYHFQGWRRVNGTNSIHGWPPMVNEWDGIPCDGSHYPTWLRLPLVQVLDRHGNEIHYSWDAATSANIGRHGLSSDDKPDANGCHYVRAIRLTEVRYNGEQVKVSFQYDLPAAGSGRWDRPEYYDHTGVRLFAIHTLTGVTVSVNDQVVRQYALDYFPQSTGAVSQTQLNLQRIREQAGGLERAISFTYAPSGMTNACSYSYLNQVTGPLGGAVAFTADPHSSDYENPHPPTVSSRTEIDPVTERNWVWNYGYNDGDWSQKAYGYSQAKVLTPPADSTGGARLLEVHTFFTTVTTGGGAILTHLAGRASQLRTCPAVAVTDNCSTASELNRAETDWQHTTADLPFGSPPVSEDRLPRFVYASETRTYELGQPFKRTTYEYQAERQGGQNYGNPTRIKEYNSQANNFKTNAFRTTSIWYYPNPTTGIIGLPARRQLYIGDETTLFAETRNYYDNTTDDTAPPTFGRLKHVETLAVLNGVYQSNPASSSQYYDYDEYGNLTWAQDANGHTTTYFYDAGFQAFRVCEQNAAGHQTKTTYYGVPGDGACNTTNGSAGNLAGRFGQREKAWDANNALTEYAYDDLGRPLKVAIAPSTLASNTQTQWFHYKPISETISAGNPFWVHRLQRDEQATNNNYLHTWTFYDGFGRILQTQAEAANARHVETSYTYTWRDAVARASVPRFVDGDVAQHPETGGPPWPAYAALDETTWAGLPKTVSTYDALGRVTQTTAPDNATTRQYYAVGLDEQYNTARRLEAVIDARNVQTIRAYDVFGRLSRSKEYSATDYTTPRWNDTPYAVASYGYNIADQLTDAYDPANNRIQITYDGLGRKAAMSDPDLGAWSYTYDTVGNLQTQTDARGTTLWFGYDSLNRLTQKRLSHSTGALLAEYKYDESGYGYSAGRRTRAIAYVSGAPNTIAWTYDVRGRVVSDLRTIAGSNYLTAYTYDAADRVRTLTYPESGEVVTTTYTAQGLPYSLTGPQAAYVFSTTYDALGQRDLRVYQPAALQSDTIYYAWSAGPGSGGRLQRLKSGVGSGSTALQNLTYAYDPAGNLARLRDDNNSGQRQCFSYDPLGRLTGALIGDTNCAPTTGGNGYYPPEVYAYAANGNLTSKAGVSYTYPASMPTGCTTNTPTTKPHAVAAITGYGFTYDCNGNQLTRPEPTGTYTQAYDSENRLSTVTVSGQTTTYTYDADGALVKKVQGGQTTVYVGQHFEKNLTAGQATSYYFLGGQRVALKKAGTLYYLLTDHLGSTAVATNQSGGVVAQQLYKPWGESRWSSGTLPTDRKLTGQRSEEATLGSLYDYGARAYSPRLGRFLSADTIVPSPGDPQSLNRYAYVRNNPLRYTDPTGHAWREDDSGGGWYPPLDCSKTIMCLPRQTAPTPANAWRPPSAASTGPMIQTSSPYRPDDGWILRYHVYGDVDPRLELVYLSGAAQRGVLPVSASAEYRHTWVLDEGEMRSFDEFAYSYSLGEIVNAGIEATAIGGAQPFVGVGVAGVEAQLQANQIMVGIVNPAGVGGGRVGAEYTIPMAVALVTSQATLVDAGGPQKLGARTLGPNAIYDWGIHIPGAAVSGVWVSGAQRAYAWANFAPVREIP